jgi:hypothetical protein
MCGIHACAPVSRGEGTDGRAPIRDAHRRSPGHHLGARSLSIGRHYSFYLSSRAFSSPITAARERVRHALFESVCSRNDKPTLQV